MKLTPTRRTDYGLAAMIRLAEDPERRLNAAEVAEDMRVPQLFVRNILQSLQRARLVTSQPGRHGGYALARPAEHISALEVVEALEGSIVPGECSLQGMPCRWEPVCPRLQPGLAHEDVCLVYRLWLSVRLALAEQLEAKTLADLAAQDLAFERGAGPRTR